MKLLKRNRGCEHEREDERDLRPADDGHGVTFRSRISGSGRSEFLGMDQRVEEIDAEADADDQSDDGFDHRVLPLQPVAGGGVGAHHARNRTPRAR